MKRRTDTLHSLYVRIRNVLEFLALTKSRKLLPLILTLFKISGNYTCRCFDIRSSKFCPHGVVTHFVPLERTLPINLLPWESPISHTTGLNGIRLRDINVRSAEEHRITKLRAVISVLKISRSFLIGTVLECVSKIRSIQSASTFGLTCSPQ